MSLLDELNGRVVAWKQGTVLPGGGFGQITAGNWIELTLSNFGPLAGLVGVPIRLSFVGGAATGKVWSSSASAVLGNNTGIRIPDLWPTVGLTRTVGASGLVQINFPELDVIIPDPDPEPEPEPEPDPSPDPSPDPDPVTPMGSLPTPDPLDKSLSDYFTAALKDNERVNRTVHCNSLWWLLLLAAAAYALLKKR